MRDVLPRFIVREAGALRIVLRPAVRAGIREVEVYSDPDTDDLKVLLFETGGPIDDDGYPGGGGVSYGAM
jgi:hypothetical protein